MVRFQPQHRRRNYLARREQWRLLALVLALGLIGIMMNQLRHPGTIALLERIFTGSQDRPESHRRLSDAEVAALVNEPPDALPADVFRTPAPRNVGDSEGDYLPGLQPSLLGTIEDNTPFRGSETEIWFHLWEVLNSTTEEELTRAADEVGYVQLVEQPEAYRGRPATIRGTARRVETVRPTDNQLGIDRLHLLTIRPTGSQIWPIRVYCLELPEGFPHGDDVMAEITATGFFFKNWSYQWDGGMGLAPVIMARTVEWVDPPAADSNAKMPSLLTVTLAAIVLACVLIGYVFWNSWNLRRDAPEATGDDVSHAMQSAMGEANQ